MKSVKHQGMLKSLVMKSDDLKLHDANLACNVSRELGTSDGRRY